MTHAQQKTSGFLTTYFGELDNTTKKDIEDHWELTKGYVNRWLYIANKTPSARDDYSINECLHGPKGERRLKGQATASDMLATGDLRFTTVNPSAFFHSAGIADTYEEYEALSEWEKTHSDTRCRILSFGSSGAHNRNWPIINRDLFNAIKRHHDYYNQQLNLKPRPTQEDVSVCSIDVTF